VVAGGLALVGTGNGSVYAVQVSSGTLAWRVTTAAAIDGSPAVDGPRVFVVSESSSTGRATVSALDAATGRRLWTYQPSRLALHSSSPTAAGGKVYVAFGDLVVRALDQTGGTVVWAQQVRGDFSAASTPALAGGDLFVQDREGGVVRLDARTGSRRWDFQFPSVAVLGAPLVSGGAVYVGLDDGTVAAIRVSSGHLVWKTRLRFGPIGALTPAGDLLLAPSTGSRGGIVAFAHDPGRRLVDVHSPSELNVTVALMNFAGAFVAMAAILLGMFALLARWEARRTGDATLGRVPADAAGGDVP
jgi:outer membrane protein assembly factor BamB